MAGFGLEPTGERVGPLLRRYETSLPSRLPLRAGRVMPGVVELLDCLRARPDVVSLLLTGNTEAGARAKLRHYGLDRYFDRGAFANGCHDRPSVARKAAALAREIVGAEIRPEHSYVIGDTPHDIHCAREIGARAVAVASGSYSVEDLSRHDPWWVIVRLPEPDVFLKRLEGMPK